MMPSSIFHLPSSIFRQTRNDYLILCTKQGGTMTILVTGATGNVGRLVVDHLLAAGSKPLLCGFEQATMAHRPATA